MVLARYRGASSEGVKAGYDLQPQLSFITCGGLSDRSPRGLLTTATGERREFL